MHGGHDAGSASTRLGLAALGWGAVRDGAEAARQLAAKGVAYLPLAALCPALADLFALKPVLSGRTVVNSVARELNPAGARAQIQGVFHPPSLPPHTATQLALGQQRALSFKRGSGEGQRNPGKSRRAVAVEAGHSQGMLWRQLTNGACWPWRDEPLALWAGGSRDGARRVA